MRIPARLVLSQLLSTALLFVTMASVSAAPASITIGSKKFPENRILAEIMAQLIEAHTTLKVIRKHNLGGTIVAFSALRSGQLDIYPEYTGTGWAVMLKRTDKVRSSLQAYTTLKHAFAQRWQLSWLQPFGFSNSYCLAMRKDRAKALGIKTISDLQKHAKALRVGVSHEFLNRKDGFPGLAKEYGLAFPNLRGLDHGLAYKAVDQKRLDLVDVWTTDGKLLRYPLRVLRDDKRFFPPYDATPLARTATLRKHPKLKPLLARLAYRLPTRKMQALNYRAEKGVEFDRIARDFLVKEGLLQKAAPRAQETRPGLFAYMWRKRAQLGKNTKQHLYLTFLAVLLATLLSVPLGIWLTRFPAAAPPVLSAVGVLQTIPSLALLAFLLPVLGLGARSAIAALFLYALLPIVRNTYAGIQEVDDDLIEAGRGMGLTKRQILWHIELPLASRTIIAGIRVATVISIGVATLAAFIGAGGLGEPILTGLNLDDRQLILSGALPAALLAILADWLLGRIERWLIPAGAPNN